MSVLRQKENEKGFTLVELMVVVVIIGILVAIAVPIYNNVTKSANREAVEANLRTIDSAIMQYGAVTYGETPAKEDIQKYVQYWPEGPDGVEYDINDNGKRAVISKGSSGAWFTTTDKSLPITW